MIVSNFAISNHLTSSNMQFSSLRVPKSNLREAPRSSRGRTPYFCQFRGHGGREGVRERTFVFARIRSEEECVFLWEQMYSSDTTLHC
jgi:hypothetical protein